MPGGKPKEGSELQASYSAHHDLREVFSRDNTSRRRQAGHTLRKYLTDKQDKQLLNSFVKIRDGYEVSNNSDVVIVWAQMQIKAGKKDELHDKLVAAAERVTIDKKPDASE